MAALPAWQAAAFVCRLVKKLLLIQRICCTCLTAASPPPTNTPAGGGKELEEPLVVRPTSETIVNHMFAQVGATRLHQSPLLQRCRSE